MQSPSTIAYNFQAITSAATVQWELGKALMQTKKLINVVRATCFDAKSIKIVSWRHLGSRWSPPGAILAKITPNIDFLRFGDDLGVDVKKCLKIDSKVKIFWDILRNCVFCARGPQKIQNEVPNRSNQDFSGVRRIIKITFSSTRDRIFRSCRTPQFVFCSNNFVGSLHVALSRCFPEF